jgi:hypothetical protein
MASALPVDEVIKGELMALSSDKKVPASRDVNGVDDQS